MKQSNNAKIFISCGQRKDSDEVRIAEQIKKRLEEKGFDAYLAVQQQSLKGLKENIFNKLSSSEYFLFIDFKREKLTNGKFRGSLFSHQELALASFLDIELLAFQEKGVYKEDGVIGFLQTNCIPFINSEELPDKIISKINDLCWRPDWKNQLIMERDAGQYTNARRFPEDKDARFFHIKIKNQNPYKQARNCYAYLEKLQNLSTGESIPIETIEFKWAGYIYPNVTILPSSWRALDGFFVFHNSPTKPQFNVFTDCNLYHPNIEGPGDYKLTFMILSENFETVRSTFKLHLGNSLEDIKFELINNRE